jgi:hypothetical protein
MGAGAGEAPESAVSAPDASVLRVDDELDPLLRSGEVAAAGAGAVAAAADVVAGAEAPLPLVQPASSTTKPLATIKQPVWNLMLAPTRQRVSRCATVMLLGSVDGGRCVTGAAGCSLERITVAGAYRMVVFD